MKGAVLTGFTGRWLVGDGLIVTTIVIAAAGTRASSPAAFSCGGRRS